MRYTIRTEENKLNSARQARSICKNAAGCFAVARAFPYVHVGDGYPHQIRLECCRVGVHRFSGLIVHGITGGLIRAFHCVLRHLEHTFLREYVCPDLADAVPAFRLCKSKGRCPSRRAGVAFQACEDFATSKPRRPYSFAVRLISRRSRYILRLPG